MKNKQQVEGPNQPSGSKVWCNKCMKYYEFEEFKLIKTVKNKTGSYRAYRDTLDTEPYKYTELTLECPKCKERKFFETDEIYYRSPTPMQIYGYRGANYGT